MFCVMAELRNKLVLKMELMLDIICALPRFQMIKRMLLDSTINTFSYKVSYLLDLFKISN